MHSKEEQAHESTAERAALSRDLQRILRERGTLDSMRRLVATAVASASATAAAAAGTAEARTASLGAAGVSSQ